MVLVAEKKERNRISLTAVVCIAYVVITAYTSALTFNNDRKIPLLERLCKSAILVEALIN